MELLKLADVLQRCTSECDSVPFAHPEEEILHYHERNALDCRFPVSNFHLAAVSASKRLATVRICREGLGNKPLPFLKHATNINLSFSCVLWLDESDTFYLVSVRGVLCD